MPALAVYQNALYIGLLSGGGYSAFGPCLTQGKILYKYTGSGSPSAVNGFTVSGAGSTADMFGVNSLAVHNNRLIVGTGSYGFGAFVSTNLSSVYSYDGVNSPTKIGGSGVNSSWTNDSGIQLLRSLVSYGNYLYAAVGDNDSTQGQIWRYDSSALTWTKLAGDGLNGSWPANKMEDVSALAVYNGKLYAGTGSTVDTDAQVWSYGNGGIVRSSTTSWDTNWHHVAATYDGATMKLYADGALVGSTSVALSMPDTTNELYVGSSIGSYEAGSGASLFAGALDELRISNTARSSFTTNPYSSSQETVTLNTAVGTSGIKQWDSWAETLTANGGSVNYRVSTDAGTTWLYWTGSAWATSNNFNQANTAATINSNISTLPVTFYGIKWQAILKGDGTQQVTINGLTAQATSDYVAPSANASSLNAKKVAAGATLAADNWTNGSSPYFAWTAGSDASSGVKGYCLYLGQDNDADPVTTKGLLGTSPTYSGGNCQFLISSENIDTGIAGYITTALSTSNNKYYLRVKTMDNAGNVSSGTASFSFYFDNTAPTNPGFITTPSSFVKDKGVTFTWPDSGGNAPSDANSGLVGLQYRLNNGTWYGDSHTGTGDTGDLLANDGSYTFIENPDFANLIDGVNNLDVRTWDAAGNVTTTYAKAAVKINSSGAPDQPQNVTATPATNTTNSFAFSWSEPAEFIGDANALTYCYTINTLPTEQTCTFTAAGVKNLSAGAYATQPGSNTFYVVAKDESGNINYSNYGSVNFTANTSAPGIPLNTEVLDASIRATSNWRLALTWEPPTDLGSGITAYRVFRSTDNSSFTQIGSSSSTSYVDTGLNNTLTYYYFVRACDSANNCGAQSEVVSKQPTGRYYVPPNMTGGPIISDVTTRKAKITWSTDRESDSRIAIGTKSGQYAESETAVSTFTLDHKVDLVNLSAGTTYYIRAKWTDSDGNIGISQEMTFTTQPAPSIKEISTPKVNLTSTIVQFTSKSATKVSIVYGLSDSFGGTKSINTSFTESTYDIELDGLQDGSKYFYKLISYDSEGNAYEGDVYSFTTPPRPRISNLRFQPIAGEPTSTQEVTWLTNVSANSSVTYGKVGTNGVDVLDSKLNLEHKIVIRGLDDNSEYFILAQSRDVDGNLAISDRQIFKTALDTRPPKIVEVTQETTIKGTGGEARGQVVVSWRTDEPATSYVEYADGSNASVFNFRTAEDTNLTTEHIVIVSDLPTSRVYSLRPASKDKSGNVAYGDAQPAIIGRASENVLTVVLNALRKVFGF